MTPEQERQIVLLMKLKREYSLKRIAHRFGVSVKTLYRVYERHQVTQYVSPTTEAPPK